MADDLDQYADVAQGIQSSENSTGNPNARNPYSTATGNGQFIDSTWLNLVKGARPELAAYPDNTLLQLRADPAWADWAVKQYASQNAQALQQSGIQATPTNLAMAHGVGPSGATKILSANPNTPVAQLGFSPQAIAENPQLQGTAGQAVGYYSKKMEPVETARSNDYLQNRWGVDLGGSSGSKNAQPSPSQASPRIGGQEPSASPAQSTTGIPSAQAAEPATQPPQAAPSIVPGQYKTVAPYQAPDGSGGLTTVAPEDFDRFQRDTARAQQGLPPEGAVAPQANASPDAPIEPNPGQGANSPQQSQAPDDYLKSRWGVDTSQRPSNTATPAQAGENSKYGMSAPDQGPQKPSALQDIGHGLVQSLHDFTDLPAEGLAGLATWGANKLGYPNVFGAPTGAEVSQQDQAARQQYNQIYGDNTLASIARFGGDVALTIPTLEVGGGLAGGAADIAGAGADLASPVAGNAVRGATNFLAGNGGGNILARGASSAANGALQGAAGAALTAGGSDQPIGQQMLNGAIGGAVVGPAVAGLGAAGKTGLNALSGYGGNLSPETANLARTAIDKYGIPLTSAELSDNPLARTATEQLGRLPFSGVKGVQDAQQKAWQRAVSNTFGENSDLVTPEVMDRAATRIGGVFNDVANRTNIQVDNQFLDDLASIEKESKLAPLGAGGHEAIDAQLQNVLDAASSGSIDGKAYQQLTRAGAPLQRAQQAGDPNTRYYATQIRDALDGAFQRSASPEDQQALAQARAQWRNMRTVEDLVEKSPDGNLSPSLLIGQVRSASNRFDSTTNGLAYKGGGDLAELARIAQRFMKPQPNSGTADRTLANDILKWGAAGAGGVGAHAAGLSLTSPFTVAGVPVVLGGNRLLQGYLRSPGYTNRLINSSLANSGGAPVANALNPSAVIGGIGARNYLATPPSTPIDEQQ